MDGLVVRAKPSWMVDASCRGMSPRVFFLEIGESSDATLAKRICCACPVRRECADAGRGEQYGIWGGQTVSARHRSRRTHQVA